MNLIIDIGNSQIKTAVFHRGKLLHKEIIAGELFVSSIEKLRAEFPQLTDLLVSHVGKMDEEWGVFLQAHFKVLPFSATTPLPFKNLYASPSTLGLDRLGLVAAAHHKFPDKNVLIIDAGTCITYDFLNADGAYLGGAISPGLQLRLKAMHTFTENLPLLEATESPQFIGTSTTACMQSGAIRGASLEIDGFTALYRDKFQDLTVILTGGDRVLLSKTIKNSIFAPSNFLLEGLNCILEFNKTP